MSNRQLIAAIVGVVVAAGLLAFLIWRPPTPTGASASPSTSPRPTPTAETPPSATASPSASPTASPTPAPEAEAVEDGRLNVLVLGSDSDVKRRERGKVYRTDAIMLISVSADGDKVLLVSLPRDSSDLPMPDGTTWREKVNAIPAMAGIPAMRDAMAHLFDVPIDYWMMMDMDGFRTLVDAVGGVTVSTPYTLTDNRCTITPGEHHLDGWLALCYARHRAVDSDYARAARVQELLIAVRDRLLSGSINVVDLVASIPSFESDIPAEMVPFLSRLARETQRAALERIVLDPPEFTTFVGHDGDRGFISIPDVGAIRDAIADHLGP